MIVFIIFIWWASICLGWEWEPPHHDRNDRHTKDMPTCARPNAWRNPPWLFFGNYFIDFFNEDNRPWRHPDILELIENPHFPPDILSIAENPTLPSYDDAALMIYQEAIMVLVEDEAASASDKANASHMYAVDMYCHQKQVKCQGSGWLLTWPWMDCRSNKEMSALCNWWGAESKELDKLTMSLLRRSYRYALIELGHKLVPFIQHVPKRLGVSKRDESFKTVVPKFAIYSQSLMDHFLDPLHQQEILDVRKPHLRDHIIPPTPLLSTVESVFSTTNQTLITLYRDSLNAYDREMKLTARARAKKQAKHDALSWQWIRHDPCFYNRVSCGPDDFWGRILDIGWFDAHLEAAEGFKKAMEEQGLVELGEKLLREVRDCYGTREELDLLLSEYVDLQRESKI
jgi:hypothetical protein